MPYSLLGLRLTMLATLALVIGASTLFISLLLYVVGGLSIVSILILVVLFNVVQWLVSPYMIQGLYRCKEVPENQSPKLHQLVERVAASAGVPKPRVMYSPMQAPNAFAYGSPLGGNRVCITQGLLDNLKDDEIEAVLGHELGHLKHRDVQIMMFVSVLPTLFYWIGLSLLWGGGYGNNRNGGNAAAIGALAMVAYFILNLLILGLGRQRELYADRHGAEVVPGGAEKLAVALAKLDAYSKGVRRTGSSSFRSPGFNALLIIDPNNTSGLNLSQLSDEELVNYVASRRETGAERLMELFSTHPNTVKRIRILRSLSTTGS
ncbi:MAG: M48 family metalloprotease [Nitrososphaerota archaeon]|jgi:heat shock protein HtpX|nr:M48 family metalloprotease [Nitrososphaerota archaeon]